MRLHPLRNLLFFLAQFLPSKFRFHWLGFPSLSRPDATPIKHLTQTSNAISAYVGFVAQSDGHILQPSVQQNDSYDMYRFIKRQRPFPKVHRETRPIVSLTFSGQTNYFHWLFENMVRLNFLDESFYHDPAGPLLHVDQNRSFQQQSIALLGLDPARILPAQKIPFVQSTKMILLPFASIDAGWQIPWLRKKFLPPPSLEKKHRRIYITRTQASSRRILNEPALLDILKPLGFESVILENLTFTQQISLFQSAQIMMGPHGAAWANLAFAPPGLHLFELMPSWGSRLYEQVSAWTGVHYHHVVTEAVNPKDKINSDTRVNLQEIERFLPSLQ